MPKVSKHLQAAVCENFIVMMDRCLRSRRASTARNENTASVASNIATHENISDNELDRSVTNVETEIQKVVELSNNINVTRGSDGSPVSAA